ncbi:MAG: YhfC family intramembrane metalloprotease [Lachnospiraceae bacterium]|nr:YhfC family intramembrane metalloprotease [Lachnospiraceae bacterium]
MLETVPGTTIFAMIFSLVLALGAPVLAAVLMKLKANGKLICTLIGIAAFVVFALVLEQLCHILVARLAGESLMDNQVFYAVYGGLSAAVFEETGRFLAMKFLMRKNLTQENSIMYGIGHGGAESILLIIVSFLPNLMTSVMINNGGMQEALGAVDATVREETVQELSVLWTTPSAEFALAGIERVLSFVLQLCLSYLVYLAVRYKKPGYYFLAMALHFTIDALTVPLRAVMSIYMAETIFLGYVLVIAFFTIRKYRREKAETGDGEYLV